MRSRTAAKVGSILFAERCREHRFFMVGTNQPTGVHPHAEHERPIHRALTSTGATVYVEGTNEELFHTTVDLTGTWSGGYVDDHGGIQYGTVAISVQG